MGCQTSNDYKKNFIFYLSIGLLEVFKVDNFIMIDFNMHLNTNNLNILKDLEIPL